MIVLIKLIVFLVQKLYYITKQSQELPRHSTALKFYVSVAKLLSCLILMRIFQNSPNELHLNSGSKKIASPNFHAVSFVCK